jgi:hypothetical protein
MNPIVQSSRARRETLAGLLFWVPAAVAATLNFTPAGGVLSGAGVEDRSKPPPVVAFEILIGTPYPAAKGNLAEFHYRVQYDNTQLIYKPDRTTMDPDGRFGPAFFTGNPETGNFHVHHLGGKALVPGGRPFLVDKIAFEVLQSDLVDPDSLDIQISILSAIADFGTVTTFYALPEGKLQPFTRVAKL